MIKVVTFGYRWEGLALHQWAFTHTDLLAVVLPGNRLEAIVSGMVREWAFWFRVPLLCQENQDSQKFVGQLELLKPDIILCHCYTYRLTKDILAIPRLGCVNIHPAKLPEYRGRYPVEDALSKGETILWASIHYMDEGFDTGAVITQVPVARRDNLQEMRGELTKAGLRLLEEKWSSLTKK